MMMMIMMMMIIIIIIMMMNNNNNNNNAKSLDEVERSSPPLDGMFSSYFQATLVSSWRCYKLNCSVFFFVQPLLTPLSISVKTKDAVL